VTLMDYRAGCGGNCFLCAVIGIARRQSWHIS
jgi:hypothetical protein